MYYTLGQASKACGKTKTTISNAIEKGKISATKDENGRYQIDPAELDRVYKLDMQKLSEIDHTRPQQDTNLFIENATLKAKLEAMAELKHQIEGERDNLREQNNRITALLTSQKNDQEAGASRKGFWSRLVG
jgi:hypothetical protein